MLCYLMYAIRHGVPESLALELIQFTLIVVSLSIPAHGTNLKPLMARSGSPQEPAGGVI